MTTDMGVLEGRENGIVAGLEDERKKRKMQRKDLAAVLAVEAGRERINILAASPIQDPGTLVTALGRTRTSTEVEVGVLRGNDGVVGVEMMDMRLGVKGEETMMNIGIETAMERGAAKGSIVTEAIVMENRRNRMQ